MRQIRSDFLEEAAALTGEFLAAFESGVDPEALRRWSHRWAGSGKMLGFDLIGSAATELNRTLKAGADQDELKAALQDLRNRILSEKQGQAT